MVQVLPASQGFGSQLLDALTQGTTKIAAAKSDRNQQINLNRPKAQKALYSIFKQYKADPQYDIENRRRAEKLAEEYVNKGYDPYQAASTAYEDMVAGFPEKNSKNKSGENTPIEKPAPKQTILESILGISNKPIGEVIKPVHQFLRSPLTAITQLPREKLQQAVKNKNQELAAQNEEALKREKEKPFKLPKNVQNLSYKEILDLPADAVTSLPMKDQLVIGQKLAEGAKLATDFAFTSGLDPTGLVQGAERKLAEKGISPIPEQTKSTATPLAISKTAGELLKDYLLFNVAGSASTTPKKVGLAAGLFGAEKGLKKSIGEGKEPTVGEIATSAAFGAGGELLAPIYKAVSGFIKKVPATYDSIKTAVKGSRGAVTEEKIISEAAKNLEARGVSVIKAAEGDKTALNELQKESSKVANTFKEADKYNKKELEKVRGEKAEKLVQSPLEEYYAPAKEVKHRPETLAKEAERIKPLQAHIHKNERRLQNLQYEIFSAENRLKEAGHSMSVAEKERVEALINSNRISHQKALNEIRSAQFEIKHKVPPRTTEEIREGIEKSFADIREGIKDPITAKVEKLKKALKDGEDSLKTAEKLVARGELPGPKVFDEFIKIKQEYVKAYEELIDELKNFIKEHKNSKPMASQVENARNLQNLIQQTREQAKASIVKQIDKRKAMKTLEGPSGALWKNLLKDVRTDVEAFQKDWIKANRLLSKQEIKTGEAAKRSLPQAAKEPKPLAAKEAVQKASEPLKETISSMGEKISKGTSNEKDVAQLTNALSKWLKRINNLPKQLLTGFGTGILQSLLEKAVGLKLPAGLLGAILPRGTTSRSLGYGSAAFGYKVSNNFFNELEARKLRKLRNTPEFNKRRSELESRYSKSRVNKILKLVDHSK